MTHSNQAQLLDLFKKEVFVEDLLRDNQLSISIENQPFILEDVKRHHTRDGTQYYRIEISDKTGRIVGKIWNDALERAPIHKMELGDIIVVSGLLEEFNGRRYVNVKRVFKVSEAQVNIEDLVLNHTKEDISILYERLKGIIKKVQNPHIKQLLSKIFIENTKIANAFKASAAAESVHHDYVGGLLEHTLEMYDIAQALLKHYPEADKDLVTAGVLLHDIGKIIEYETMRFKVRRTKKGYLLGHIHLGIELILQHLPKDFPEEYKIQLIHIILSHHGEIEFGAAVRPATIEAIIVSVVDDASSKVKQYQKELRTKKPDEQGFSDYQKYIRTRVYFSHLAREHRPAGNGS